MMPNGRKIYQHFPFQGPPKYTQIGILVLKYTIWQPCFCYKCLNWIGRRMNNRFLWRFNSPQFPFSKQKTSNLNLYVHKAFGLLHTWEMFCFDRVSFWIFLGEMWLSILGSFTARKTAYVHTFTSGNFEQKNDFLHDLHPALPPYFLKTVTMFANIAIILLLHFGFHRQR
jgi:hypothetical protein